MAYAEIYSWGHGFCPEPGESYSAFKNRASIGLSTLYASYTPEMIDMIVEESWSAWILENAVEMLVSLKRNVNPNSIYNGWYCDWSIKEVHSAVLPNVTYTTVEKSRPAEGTQYKVAKSVEDKQLVFGWANVAKDANGNYPLDWDGDVTSPEHLENAAYSYVLKYRAMGEVHEGEVKGELVESVMLTKEKQEAMGIPDGLVPEGWWVGFYIPDKEVFAKVKSGEYEMFSVQGDAFRVPTGQ